MMDKSHEEYMIKYLRNDPEYAAELLNSILEDGGQEELPIALRRISAAFAGEKPQLRRLGDRPPALRE